MYQFQLIATMKPSLILPPGVTLKVAIIYPPPPNPFHSTEICREAVKETKLSKILPPGVTLKVAIIHPPPPNPFHGAWMRREPIKKQAVPKPKLSKSEKGTVAP